MRHGRLALIFLLISLFPVASYGQESKPSAPEPAKHEKASGKASAAKSKATQPNVSQKIFGDWALRCLEGANAGAANHGCEISQTIESKDQAGPVAKISVGRPKIGDPLHAVIILPNNVSFPSSVHVRTDQKDQWGFELDWVRCIPGGCFAEAVLPDPTVQHWHGLNTVGTIVFTNAAGDEIALPMTFRGFGDALDALNKS